METGRLPSLLGREFFRAKMSWWRPATFEDAVIFVHDVERSLEKLDRREQELIAKIVLQEHTQLETARMLHSTLRTVARNYADALDHLSEIFLAGEILTPFAAGGEEARKFVSRGKRRRIPRKLLQRRRKHFLKSWHSTPMQDAILDLDSKKKQAVRSSAIIKSYLRRARKARLFFCAGGGDEASAGSGETAEEGSKADGEPGKGQDRRGSDPGRNPEFGVRCGNRNGRVHHRRGEEGALLGDEVSVRDGGAAYGDGRRPWGKQKGG